jgi:hypothetical protein
MNAFLHDLPDFRDRQEDQNTDQKVIKNWKNSNSLISDGFQFPSAPKTAETAIRSKRHQKM